MKKYSIATHVDDKGMLQGVTIQGDSFYETDGILYITRSEKSDDGATIRPVVAAFARGEWRHIFDVDASPWPG